MELRNLIYLEAIYRLRSFTRAAEEQYISQPSITNAIQKLEQELGTVLIDRKTKPLSFTAKGERFMEHVYNILDEASFAVEEARRKDDQPKVELNMYVASVAADWVIPAVYTQFLEQHPNYHVKMREEVYAQMLENILNESMDLAFTIFPENYDLYHFEVIPLLQCELCIMMRHDHPLAHCERVTLQQLSQERLLMPWEGALIRTRLEEEFRRAHIPPNFQTVQQVRVAQTLVEQNYGLTFVTSDCQKEQLETYGLTAVPLATPIYFTKGFLMKRGRTRAPGTNEIISFLQQVVAERQSQLRKSASPGELNQ